MRLVFLLFSSLSVPKRSKISKNLYFSSFAFFSLNLSSFVSFFRRRCENNPLWGRRRWVLEDFRSLPSQLPSEAPAASRQHFAGRGRSTSIVRPRRRRKFLQHLVASSVRIRQRAAAYRCLHPSPMPFVPLPGVCFVRALLRFPLRNGEVAFFVFLCLPYPEPH